MSRNIKNIIEEKDVIMSISSLIGKITSEIYRNLTEGFNILGVAVEQKDNGLYLGEAYDSMIEMVELRLLEEFTNRLRDTGEPYADFEKQRKFDSIKVVVGDNSQLAQVQHMLTR